MTTTAIKLDAATTVMTKMTKKEAASLVRFLTEAIAETNEDTINILIDLRNDFDGAQALISATNSTMFGSRAAITETRVISYEGA
jgi:hypothetical protein